MTDQLELGDFVTDELYPGYKPGFLHAPYNVDAIRPFSAADASSFWLGEGHWPRGIVPLGFTCIEACAWGTQWAAQALPVPTGRGLSARMAATHVYNSEIPVTAAWELEARGRRAAESFPARIAGFPHEWEKARDQLVEWLERLEQWDLDGAGVEQIAPYFAEALSMQQWAWEQHFLFMYPLLANYFGFRGLCEELSIDTDLVPRFLQGYDTKILETDRALWRLALAARESGLERHFSGPVSTLAELGVDPEAHQWVAEFGEFLSVYGWRTEGMADPDLAPWVEDPTPALNAIAAFVIGAEQDFDTIREANQRERGEAVDRARAGLTTSEREAFDGALAACQSANFSWWNEEHDFYIDLRVHIPLRRAALALGRAVQADRADDPLYLFRSEFDDVLSGALDYAEVAGQIPARREHRAEWAARRPDMPKLMGTIPEDVTDPVLKEIFGMSKNFFDVVRKGHATGDALTGVAASAGTYTGRARLIRHAMHLGELLEGEVLVCEFTSPNWTPAFTRIGACVADQGGVLSHTAIVSREYRVPCVTGVAIGTNVVRDGDLVEVDGNTGTVRILQRAVLEPVS